MTRTGAGWRDVGVAGSDGDIFRARPARIVG